MSLTFLKPPNHIMWIGIYWVSILVYFVAALVSQSPPTMFFPGLKMASWLVLRLGLDIFGLAPTHDCNYFYSSVALYMTCLCRQPKGYHIQDRVVEANQ